MTSPTSVEAAAFNGQNFINLITFRKNGQPVTTPVWFAQRGTTLYVYTQITTGKIKRIRANNAVQVEPCTWRGTPTGPKVSGTAQIITGSEVQSLDALLIQKYGWQKKVGDVLVRFRKNAGEPVMIMITLNSSST